MRKTFFPNTHKEPDQKQLLDIMRACKGDPWPKGHYFRAINNLSRSENILDFGKLHQTRTNFVQ